MQHGKIYDSILDTIGNTPLVRLNNLNTGGAEIVLKLEFFNPLSSVKDRIGLAMVNAIEKSGVSLDTAKLVEPTSGNTGIALAFVAAAKGLDLTLTMPESMSLERRKMLKFLGAKLELTPVEKGMSGAIARAKELESKGYISVGQFENPANPAVHEATTAQEILRDTGGEVDIFITGVGTGGSISGVGKILKQHNPHVQIIAVEPEDSPVLSGGRPGPHKIQGIGAGFIPENYHANVVDKIYQVANETAFTTSRAVAKSDGIPVGISSGATIAVALELSELPENAGKRIVAIVASTAERYQSTPLFDET